MDGERKLAAPSDDPRIFVVCFCWDRRRKEAGK
jgi:hypothetical protein